MDSLEFYRNSDGKLIINHVDETGMVMGHTVVPPDEWELMRAKVKQCYDLDHISRGQAIDLITALTVTLETGA
jgi:hypothetical protein